MEVAESAELFAKERYSGTVRGDGVLHLDHLRGVVTRLKSLGISDEDIIASAWLYGIMNETGTAFDDIDKRFGSKIAVLVLALFRDSSIPKDKIDRQYIKQLKESPIEIKLIKLCDISTSLKDLKNAPWSKTRKTKYVKKVLHYLSIMKHNLSEAKSQYSGIQNIMYGINETVASYGQRPIIL